jgi:hypothetical protein
MFTALNQAARNQFIANGIGLVNSPVPVAAIPILGNGVGEFDASGRDILCVRDVGERGGAGRFTFGRGVDCGSGEQPDDGDGDGSAGECGRLQRIRGNCAGDDDSADQCGVTGGKHV